MKGCSEKMNLCQHVHLQMASPQWQPARNVPAHIRLIHQRRLNPPKKLQRLAESEGPILCRSNRRLRKQEVLPFCFSSLRGLTSTRHQLWSLEGSQMWALVCLHPKIYCLSLTLLRGFLGIYKDLSKAQSMHISMDQFQSKYSWSNSKLLLDVCFKSISPC